MNVPSVAKFHIQFKEIPTLGHWTSMSGGAERRGDGLGACVLESLELHPRWGEGKQPAPEARPCRREEENLQHILDFIPRLDV